MSPWVEDQRGKFLEARAERWKSTWRKLYLSVYELSRQLGCALEKTQFVSPSLSSTSLGPGLCSTRTWVRSGGLIHSLINSFSQCLLSTNLCWKLCLCVSTKGSAWWTPRAFVICWVPHCFLRKSCSDSWITWNTSHFQTGICLYCLTLSINCFSGWWMLLDRPGSNHCSEFLLTGRGRGVGCLTLLLLLLLFVYFCCFLRDCFPVCFIGLDYGLMFKGVKLWDFYVAWVVNVS